MEIRPRKRQRVALDGVAAPLSDLDEPAEEVEQAVGWIGPFEVGQRGFTDLRALAPRAALEVIALRLPVLVSPIEPRLVSDILDQSAEASVKKTSVPSWCSMI